MGRGKSLSCFQALVELAMREHVTDIIDDGRF